MKLPFVTRRAYVALEREVGLAANAMHTWHRVAIQAKEDLEDASRRFADQCAFSSELENQVAILTEMNKRLRKRKKRVKKP